MARLSKEELARREGMGYALRIAKEKGVKALEDDLRWRDALNVPVKVSKKDLDTFSANVREQTFTTVLTLMLVVLHDEWGFGRKRLEKTMDHFWGSTIALSDPDYASWQDYVGILKNECGIEIELSTSNQSNYTLKGDE